ncbi:hypothetical protein CPB85DRAFT_166248 [Mucidula mucida]|nr:hypothetical protein CPB85DRAFT_166248 [Mucidula mucida]
MLPQSIADFLCLILLPPRMSFPKESPRRLPIKYCFVAPSHRTRRLVYCAPTRRGIYMKHDDGRDIGSSLNPSHSLVLRYLFSRSNAITDRVVPSKGSEHMQHSPHGVLGALQTCHGPRKKKRDSPSRDRVG